MSLRKLSGGHPPALRALYEDYLAELVSFGAHYRRDPSGAWQPDLFGWWLTPREETEVLLIEEDQELAGFVFVGHRPFPYMNAANEHVVSEFFVRPALRGRGLGARAAKELFARTPGRWELSVLPRNEPALRFWRRVLAPYGEVREQPDQDERSFQFEVRPGFTGMPEK